MADWQDANYPVKGEYINAYENWGPADSAYAQYRYTSNHKSHSDGQNIWIFLLSTDAVNDTNVNETWRETIGFELKQPANAVVKYNIMTGIYWTTDEGTLPAELYPLAYPGTVYTHDNIETDNDDDIVYTGLGNDRIIGHQGDDQLFGGAGNDVIEGRDGKDLIYGDGVNSTIYGPDDKTWQAYDYLQVPDTNIDGGDDELHGGNNSDTIFGGAGNDVLDGGDRGSGWLDILTGGAGADSFYLSYQQAKDDGTPASPSFWSAMAEGFTQGSAASVTSDIIDKVASDALNAYFDDVSAGMILNGITSVAQGEVAKGISALFGITSSGPKPKSTGEDVMIVTDFDPREDNLILPVTKGLSIFPTIVPYTGSGDPNLVGELAIQFDMTDQDSGDLRTFAQVFLSDDFKKAVAGDDTNFDFRDIINQIVLNPAQFDADNPTGGETSYPFPVNPDYYDENADLSLVTDQLNAPAAANSTIFVYGAFGPVSYENPVSENSTGTLTGTHMGDILTVNKQFVDPTKIASGNTVVTVGAWTVMAFDGDDIVFGGAGPDFVYGGDGDDTIYGVGQTSTDLQEVFSGDGGNDLIYLGWSQTAAAADGGDGVDTVDFSFLDPLVFYDDEGITLRLDLSMANPSNNNPNGTAYYRGTSADPNRYVVTLMENVIGSPGNDTITGDGAENYIDGGAGNDFLSGGDGEDTLEGGADSDVLFGGDGDDFLSGSYMNDLLYAGNGDDTLTGGYQNDLMQGDAGYDLYLGIADEYNGDRVVMDFFDIIQIQGWTEKVEPINDEDPSRLGLYDGAYFTAWLYSENGDAAYPYLQQKLYNETDWVLLGPSAALAPAAVQKHLGGDTPTTRVSAADDLVLGTSGDETLKGWGGDDLLHGFDGSDFLGGGRGDDILVGGAGALDVLRGGPGADIFAFRDELRNGVHEQDLVQDFDPLEDPINLGGHRVNGYVEMADSLLLMVGRDQDAILLRGVSDIDSVVLLDDQENRIGPLGSDAVEYDFVVTERNPGLGLPKIAASSADDLVLGTARDETLKGVGGDDLLLGFDGSDYVAGGRGDDSLAGGAGELDTLRGGPGSDVFVFRDELDNGVREKDVIQDFNPLEDAIDLGGYRIGSHVETADSLLLVVGPDGDEILLRGVSDIDSVVFLDDPEPWIEPDALEPIMDAAQQPDWLA